MTTPRLPGPAPRAQLAPPPPIVKHPGCPQWGLGYLIEERDEKRFYEFEDGLSHSIAKPFWSKLEPVSLDSDELAALEAKIKTLKVKMSPARKPRARHVAPPSTTFEEQVARFEKTFVGGFEGDAFVAAERGIGETAPDKKAKAVVAWAVATAKRALSKTELSGLIAAGSFADVIARVREVHKSAGGLLHPLGDLIPFGKMPAERHEAFSTALFDLLYGSDEYGARFDRFVAVLATDKLATWPLVTVLPALLEPKTHAFVKPSLYEKQAAILGIDIGYERVPSAASYARMQSLASTVDAKLREKSLTPRDNLDVYAFIKGIKA
jgi:hypothetical protein